MVKELWKHQVAGVEMARELRHLALFFEMGCGKTGTMITILREEFMRHKRIMNTLIFAPISVCVQWKREFENFSKISQDAIFVLIGPGKKRAEILRKQSAPCIVVTNYEGLNIKEFYTELTKWKPEIIVMDESQRLKDSTSKRAKLIYPLCDQARRRFLMTGTPILNSMLDVFGQFRAMDPNIFGKNFFVFRNKYFYDKNANMPAHVRWPDWIPRKDTAENIGRVISQNSVQAKKEECLDLPPLHKITVPVELSSEQSRAYEMMKKHFVAECQGKVITAEFAMTKMLRLLQILAGFLPTEEGEITVFKENLRLVALRDLLDSIGPDHKIIVWSNFVATYRMIEKVCQDLGRSYNFLTGEQSANQKQESIDNFCKGSGQVLIANQAAGGVGVSLSESDYSVYFTRGFNLEHDSQSSARNHRFGSQVFKRIVHYNLCAMGTLDEVVTKALDSKQSMADAVLAYARGLR